MKSKKKLLTILLAAASAVACVFGLAGCNGCNKNPDNTDNTVAEGFETGWTSDGDYHWHAATDGSDLVDGKAMHDWVVQEEQNVAATCTHEGKTVYMCSTCEKTKEETQAQLEHKWSEQTSLVGATCTTAGMEYKTCTNSGCTATTTVKYINALGHDAPAATCTEASVCTREGCNATVAPALGHNYKLSSSTAATCTEDETAHFTCSHEGCDSHYDTTLSPAKGHVVVWDDGVNVPVGEGGVCYKIVYTASCPVCDDYTATKFIEVKEHSYTGRITSEATCTAEGNKHLTCSVCHDEKDEAIAKVASAHVWTEGVTENGVTMFHCSEDPAHTKTSLVSIDKEATLTADDIKSADEVKLGDTSIALDENVKNALGSGNVAITANTQPASELPFSSNFINGSDTVYDLTLSIDGSDPVHELGGKVTVTVPYTLTADDDPDHIVIWYIDGEELVEIEGVYAKGFVTFETNHFSYYTVTRMTPAQRCEKYGHAWNEHTEEATCLVSGYVAKFCSRCGRNEKTDIPAPGHKWEETKTAATCTKAGNEHYACSVCKIAYDVVVPAVGHVWTATENVPATCTSAGHAAYKCENCEEKYSVTLAQTPHVFKTTVVEATCTTGGYSLNVCLDCGLKNETDHVAALGHDAKTKVVPPTCTVDGFTGTYCARCEQELSKTDIVKATGHSLANGVCTVCGHGCKHNYVAGAPVEATCTTDGYTVYTCNNCKNAYKGDIIKATGHSFDVDACTVCGEPSAAATEYYLNLLNTTVGGTISLTVSDMTYKVRDNKYNGETLISSEVQGEVEQIDVAYLTLTLSGSGDVVGGGEGSVKVTAEGETADISCKLAVKDGKVYVIVSSDKSYLVPAMYVSMSFDYMLDGMTNGALNYAKLRDYLRWYNSDVEPVLSNLIKTNSTMVTKILQKVMNSAFVRTKVEGGYTYTPDFDKVKELNEMLHTKKISEIADEVLGEGTYAKIPAAVTMILNLTPAQALDFAAANGLNKEQVCAAIDSCVFLLKGDSEFNSAKKLDELLKTPVSGGVTYNDTSVAEFIMMFMSQQSPAAEAEGESPKAAFIGEVVARITALLDEYKDKTVYDVVATLISAKQPGGKPDIPDDEKYPVVIAETEEPALDGDAIYGYVKDYIDKYLEQVKSMAQISFTTDEKGNIISATVGTDIEDMPVGEHTGSDGITDKTVVSETMNVEIKFSGTASADDKVIADVIAQMPKLDKNTKYVVYSSKNMNVRHEDKRYPNLITYSEGKEMIIHTDARGDIVKVVISTERLSRSIMEYYSYYVDVIDRFYTELIEYDVTPGALTVISKDYCKNVDLLELNAVYTRSSGSTNYYRWINFKTNDVIREYGSNNSYKNNDAYNTTVQLYYNTAEKKFLATDPHDYKNLVLNEEKSNIVCNGYEVYECPDKCGYTSTRNIYHLSYEYERKYELVEGATSCEEGVKISEICPVCKETVYTKTIEYHQEYLKDVIDLTEYGAKCKHTINLYGCTCGKFYSTAYNGYHYYGDFGDKNDYMTYRALCVNAEGEKVSATVFCCPVSDCGFKFAYYTDIYTDDKCYGYAREHLILGVTYNGTEYVTAPATGGKELDKDLRYDYGYHHNETVTTTEVPGGKKTEYKCAKCGFVSWKEETTSVKDEAKNTTTETYTNIRYYQNDDGEISVNGNKTVTVYDDGKGYGDFRNYVKTEYSGGDETSYNNKYVTTVTYKYNSDSNPTEKSEVTLKYDNSGELYQTIKYGYEYEYVDGNRYTFPTLEYRENYNADGTVKGYTKIETTYPADRCHKVVHTTTGSNSDRTETRVSHTFSWNSEIVEEPTCTQYGSRKCLFCEEVEQSSSPNGHSYYHGVCYRCGLKNPLGYDGEVWFEDMSYKSSEEYVIGYRNGEAEKYSFLISLINLKAESEEDYEIMLSPADVEYTDSNTAEEEKNYYRSGTVSFPVAAIANAAEKYGLTEYMIRVTYVSEYFGGEQDYSITIDVHNWIYGEFNIIEEGKEPATVTMQYCDICGAIHGAGYIDWNVNAKGGSVTYQGYKNGTDYSITLPADKAIADFPVKGEEGGDVSEPVEPGTTQFLYGEQYEYVYTMNMEGDVISTETFTYLIVFVDDICRIDGVDYKYIPNSEYYQLENGLILTGAYEEGVWLVTLTDIGSETHVFMYN